MSLEFIIGRAGSGKTTALYERAAEAARAGGSCFVIVEDQATFDTERGLAEYLGGGLYNCAVYSWSSLARRALDRSGDRRTYLAPQGKLMLVRRAIDSCAKKLTVFSKSAACKGFGPECETLIRRFKSCALTPEALREAAAGLDEASPLRAKLGDIALIWEECEALMRERYIDSEDMMNALCARLEETELKGAHVFIDGGGAMNEQCCRAFAGMLKCCAEVCVTFYGGTGRDRALFAPEYAAYKRLCEIADSIGVEYKTTYLTPANHGRAPALYHLERELFAHPYSVFEGEPDGLEIYCARDRQDEAEHAAENILKAVSSGLRFRDTAVEVSDISAYAPVISRVFNAYGIPYFLDVGRKAAEYPVSELILSALTAVERGFDPESVLRVLKTGLCGVDEADAELFENHIIEKGPFSAKVTEPFTDAPEGAERARKLLMEPLLAFKQNIHGGTAAQRARAVYEYMRELDVYGSQKRLVTALHEAGEFKKEEENARVLNTVTELLDQIYVILGESSIGLGRFISVVREGLNAYDVSVVPTTCDQVLVGDAGRTSFRRARFMQALGLNEGLFPPRRANDGVIDDGDLAAMRGLGMTVWHNAERLCQKDNMDIYKALSKPVERLYFSFAVSCGGEITAPCSMINRIEKLFPGIKRSGAAANGPSGQSRAARLKRLALDMRRMADTGEAGEDTARLYSSLSRDESNRRTLKNLESICFVGSSPKPFGPEAALRLYGSSVSGSASRLELFNKCPFRHFARYGLRAEERKVHDDKASDLGTLFHDVIDAFTSYIVDSEPDWETIDDETVASILSGIAAPFLSKYKNGLILETARNRHRLIALTETLEETCCAIVRHIKRGSYRPFGSEVSFGMQDSIFPPLPIRLPDGRAYYLRGKIDRVDVYREPGEGGSTLHSRIIDYKTGNKKYDFAELRAGLQLQLPLYSAAVTAALGRELSPGDKASASGMYYMHITSGAKDESGSAQDGNGGAETPREDGNDGSREKPIFTEKLMELFKLNGVTVNDPQLIEAAERFDKSSTVLASVRLNSAGEYAGSGLAAEDEFKRMIDDAGRTAALTLESIYEGRAEVSPARRRGKQPACLYCPYLSVCRFDDDPGTDRYRMIEGLSADRYFEREQ